MWPSQSITARYRSSASRPASTTMKVTIFGIRRPAGRSTLAVSGVRQRRGRGHGGDERLIAAILSDMCGRM